MSRRSRSPDTVLLGRRLALLHGDEGWRFVPADHAQEEVRRIWGSRDYVAILAQPAGLVVLNLDERRAHDRMEATERSRRLTGLTMPHLNLGDVALAGFDHGAIFAFERSLLRLLAAKRTRSQALRRFHAAGYG
jgi:hypothetical protein